MFPYKKAGVHRDHTHHLLKKMTHLAKKTNRTEVLNDIGGFAALVKVSSHYRNPIMVSSTDGVGTKIKLAVEWNSHHCIGVDLVAMCVNDILVYGAEPIFFLDYVAATDVEEKTLLPLWRGMTQACTEAGCALVGGETAQLPCTYQKGEYELSGFVVGLVEEDSMIDSTQIKPGDVILGLSSSGFHANGYALVHRILQDHPTFLEKMGPSTLLLQDALLTPTRIYVKSILTLMRTISIHGMAHITGGGIVDNIKRILPSYTEARVTMSHRTQPLLLSYFQKLACLSDYEMWHIFNCGIGFVVIIHPQDVSSTIRILHAMGETTVLLGDIRATSCKEPILHIR